MDPKQLVLSRRARFVSAALAAAGVAVVSSSERTTSASAADAGKADTSMIDAELVPSNRLTIEGECGAGEMKLFVDDVEVKREPTILVTPGRHTVKLECPDHAEQHVILAMQDGQTTVRLREPTAQPCLAPQVCLSPPPPPPGCGCTIVGKR